MLLLTFRETGMHKHFRMLAISEYLRTNGYDPAVYTHIRIPGIWKKLSEFYNMPLIDDRENNMDALEDPNYDERFKDFDLPWEKYGDLIMQRALADPTEEPSSPSQQSEKSPASTRKRKRGDNVGAPKTRSSTVEESDAENEHDTLDAPPSSALKSARSTRSAKRAASKAKAEPAEEEENAEDEEEEEEEQSSEEEGESEEEEEEEEAPTTRSTRGPGRGKRRGRGRGRGRGRRFG